MPSYRCKEEVLEVRVVGRATATSDLVRIARIISDPRGPAMATEGGPHLAAPRTRFPAGRDRATTLPG